MHGVIGRMPVNTNFPDLVVSFPSGPRWYVVRTNIRCEFRAQLGLVSQGFRVFLPFITRWKRHARIAHIGTTPLFPRYLFVEADFNKQSLDALHRTDGVESIINNQGVPSSIYGDFIVDLMTRQLQGQFDLSKNEESCRQEYPVGAKVAITEGKYEDAIGYIERLKGHERAELIISIMGRKVRDTLRLAEMRPAW